MTKIRVWRCFTVVMALVFTFGMGAMAMPASPALAAAPAGTWDIQTVDEDAVGATSLALDSNGYPHISYTTWGDTDSIRYAHWTGTAWAKEMVDDVPALATSLALDSNGYPHISYTTLGDTDSIRYARWTGTAWAKEMVDDARWPYDISLALDSNNRPHISYNNAVTYGGIDSFHYAYWTGTEWVKETVDDDEKGWFSTSLALDSNNRPHISYATWDSGLLYAQWTGAGWAKETVDEGEVFFSNSLALDSNNRPHISYATWDSGLLYAQWTGADWVKETVDEGEVFFSNSLALDSNGYPHISYTTGGFASLHYASWTGAAWVKETVDEGAVLDTSLALDSNGYPHISYATAVDSLHYARFIPPNTAIVLLARPRSSSPPRPLSPAQLSAQYVTVNPQQTTAGQPVTITANVVNTGGEAGNLDVALKLNGQVEQSQMVSLDPQGIQTVEFTVTKAQPGTYNIDILGKRGSFIILGASSSTPSSPSENSGSKTVGLILLASIGILIIVSLVVLLARRT